MAALRLRPLAALAFAAALGAAAAEEPAPVLLGAVLTLTGEGAERNALVAHGYLAAVDAVNAAGGVTVAGKARPLAIVFEDDRGWVWRARGPGRTAGAGPGRDGAAGGRRCGDDGGDRPQAPGRQSSRRRSLGPAGGAGAAVQHDLHDSGSGRGPVAGAGRPRDRLPHGGPRARRDRRRRSGGVRARAKRSRGRAAPLRASRRPKTRRPAPAFWSQAPPRRRTRRRRRESPSIFPASTRWP